VGDRRSYTPQWNQRLFLHSIRCGDCGWDPQGDAADKRGSRRSRGLDEAGLRPFAARQSHRPAFGSGSLDPEFTDEALAKRCLLARATARLKRVFEYRRRKKTRETSLKKAWNHKKVEDACCLRKLHEAIPRAVSRSTFIKKQRPLCRRQIRLEALLQPTYAARPAGGRARPRPSKTS